MVLTVLYRTKNENDDPRFSSTCTLEFLNAPAPTPTTTTTTTTTISLSEPPPPPLTAEEEEGGGREGRELLCNYLQSGRNAINEFIREDSV